MKNFPIWIRNGGRKPKNKRLKPNFLNIDLKQVFSSYKKDKKNLIILIIELVDLT